MIDRCTSLWPRSTGDTQIVDSLSPPPTSHPSSFSHYPPIEMWGYRLCAKIWNVVYPEFLSTPPPTLPLYHPTPPQLHSHPHSQLHPCSLWGSCFFYVFLFHHRSITRSARRILLLRGFPGAGVNRREAEGVHGVSYRGLWGYRRGVYHTRVGQRGDRWLTR